MPTYISMTRASPFSGLTKLTKVKSQKFHIFCKFAQYNSLPSTTITHHSTTSFPLSSAAQHISLWKMHPTESQANWLLNHVHQRSEVRTYVWCLPDTWRDWACFLGDLIPLGELLPSDSSFLAGLMWELSAFVVSPLLTVARLDNVEWLALPSTSSVITGFRLGRLRPTGLGRDLVTCSNLGPSSNLSTTPKSTEVWVNEIKCENMNWVQYLLQNT